MEDDKVVEIGSPVSGLTDHPSSTPIPDGIKMPQETDKLLVNDEDTLDDDSQQNRGSGEETPCTLEESRCLTDDDEVTIKVHQENGQNEEDEEEETEPEMTPEQMKEMYDAVRTGNIDLMDDLLDLPGADINMEWFSENLLMTALRNGQTQMAMFLIDNGIDYNYTTTHMDMDETSGVIDWYTVDCRQIAYELEYWDIVDLIDEKNGKLWPHIGAKRRYIRYKKTPEMKIKEREEREERGEREESETLEENGREVTDSEGRRTPSRSESSEYSDDSSLGLTEDDNLDGTYNEDDISERSDSSGQQTGDVSVEQLGDGSEDHGENGIKRIGDEYILHDGDGNAKKTGDAGMDQTINSKRAGDSDVQVTGDGSVQETRDGNVQQAQDKQDNNLQVTCNTIRHTGDDLHLPGDGGVQQTGDIVQNKGDRNTHRGGDGSPGHITDAITEHGEEDNTARSCVNKARVDVPRLTTGEGSDVADKLRRTGDSITQKHADDGCKEGLSATDRDTRGPKPQDSATKPSGSARDDLSSGYSTMSSRESRLEMASQQRERNPKRVVHQIGTTKSYLSRKTVNANNRSTIAGRGDLPPIRTISGIGSFCYERKLWLADSGWPRPTSECSRRRHPETVTYRPWSYSADCDIDETDATRSTEYRNLVRLSQDKPYTPRNSKRLAAHSYLTPKGYRMRRSNTELLIYSSGELSNQKLRNSHIVLDIPITTRYIQTSLYGPATRATDSPRVRRTGESSLTEMTSVIRNRIAAGNRGQPGVRLLQLKKYSPAGLLKYVTKKRYV